MVAQEILILLV